MQHGKHCGDMMISIDGRLGMFEDRMSKLLYKLTVEMDMGMSAVLDCVQADDDYLRKLRSDSVRNVKATNGLLPSRYVEYMAERPRSHGLFSDTDCVNIDAAMKELNEYPGNIWTHIISLKREDAERLGYNHAAQWRNLLRAHRNVIAEAMHIPPTDFRWYAAFHDEGDHPHIHMMAWSVSAPVIKCKKTPRKKCSFVAERRKKR